MKELTERSQALQDTILHNPALLAELVKRVADVLRGKVQLPEGSTYLFTPKVFRRPSFLPEIFMQPATEATIPRPVPLPGPMDPWLVKILERQRLVSGEEAKPDPTPWKDLNAQILGSPALLGELSTAIAEVLERHAIKLAADETYAFEAVTLERPIFGGLAAEYQPSRIAATGLAAEAQATNRPPVWRWWQGIPAPELLVALDQLRLHSVSVGR